MLPQNVFPLIARGGAMSSKKSKHFSFALLQKVYGIEEQEKCVDFELPVELAIESDSVDVSDTATFVWEIK
jgi:hypothetical protein